MKPRNAKQKKNENGSTSSDNLFDFSLPSEAGQSSFTSKENLEERSSKFARKRVEQFIADCNKMGISPSYSAFEAWCREYNLKSGRQDTKEGNEA